jgi:hypothetical protein
VGPGRGAMSSNSRTAKNKYKKVKTNIKVCAYNKDLPLTVILLYSVVANHA